MTTAILDGIKNTRDPSEPLTINIYEEGHKIKSAKKLPATLLDALRLLEKSKIIRDSMGDDLINAFIKLKIGEWADYTAHLSEWERQHVLDC